MIRLHLLYLERARRKNGDGWRLAAPRKKWPVHALGRAPVCPTGGGGVVHGPVCMVGQLYPSVLAISAY